MFPFFRGHRLNARKAPLQVLMSSFYLHYRYLTTINHYQIGLKSRGAPVALEMS